MSKFPDGYKKELPREWKKEKERERDLLAKLKAKQELGFPKGESGETKENVDAESLLGILYDFLSNRNDKMDTFISNDPDLKVKRDVILEQVSAHREKIRVRNAKKVLFGSKSGSVKKQGV